MGRSRPRLRSHDINRRDITAIAADVAAAVDLAEGPSGVLDIVRAVARHEPAAVRVVSRHAELPVPLVAAVCNELRRRNVISTARPVRLTDDAREALASDSWQDAGRCQTCDGRGIVIPEILTPIAAELEQIAEAMPSARVELDQTHCTVDTKLRRVMLLSELGLLSKRIIFLGDDDVTSLAIAHAVAKTGAAVDLTVVDVDSDLLAFIEAEAARVGVTVTTVEHDLTNPLPSGLLDQFEAAFTDPPYTVQGARLFLSRAVSALQDGVGHHLMFAFGARRPSETLHTQRTIAELGLTVRSLNPNFNDYVGAGTLGGTSHMYHLRTTSETAPVITGEHTGPLYTADSRSATTRPYECTTCSRIEEVGPGQRFPRITDLKTSGCLECGNDKFRPLPLTKRTGQ